MPDFVIAGTMKSGTTSLAEWIDAHPDGYVAPVKEVHFFNANEHWEQGLGWYGENFADAGDAVAVGDATPLYSFYPEAVERMASVLPQARVIFCMRNPIDRAYSHYRHWYYRRAQEDRSWERVVDDELTADPGPPQLSARGAYDPRDPRYLQQGYYLEQLERLSARYPRDGILPVLMDADIQARPQETFRSVCAFLGLDPEVVPANVGSRANASYEFRPAALWRFMVRHHILDRLPNRLATFIALKIMRREVRYAPMDQALRARLADHFEPRNAALAEWLGREISWS